MSEKIQDIMLIEKLLERRVTNTNTSTQGINYQMPFVLLLLFILYILWKQQQDSIKEIRKEMTQKPKMPEPRHIQKIEPFNERQLIPY